MSLLGVDFRAPLRTVKRVQFGILSPDEIVSYLISFVVFYFGLGRAIRFFIQANFLEANVCWGN